MFSYPIDFLMRWRSIVKFLLHAAIFTFAYVTAYLDGVFYGAGEIDGMGQGHGG